MFLTLFWYWVRGGGGGGGQTGLVHNLQIAVSQPIYSSKIEVFGTYFFDIVIT